MPDFDFLIQILDSPDNAHIPFSSSCILLQLLYKRVDKLLVLTSVMRRVKQNSESKYNLVMNNTFYLSVAVLPVFHEANFSFPIRIIYQIGRTGLSNFHASCHYTIFMHVLVVSKAVW